MPQPETTEAGGLSEESHWVRRLPKAPSREARPLLPHPVTPRALDSDPTPTQIGIGSGEIPGT
jgi:hypothetical protein